MMHDNGRIRMKERSKEEIRKFFEFDYSESLGKDIEASIER